MYEDYLLPPSAPTAFECTKCFKKVDEKGTYVKFSCGDMTHLGCLNVDKIQTHIGNGLCPKCHDKNSDDTWSGLTVSNMNDSEFIKSLEKKKENLEHRALEFKFDKRYVSLGLMGRLNLISKGDSTGINILNVHKQKITYDFLRERGIKFNDFIDEKLHIQTIYKVFNIKEFEELVEMGFNSSHLYYINNDEEPLIPIKDLCHLYKINFKDLNSISKEPLTFIKLRKLEPDTEELKALEFSAPNIIMWKGDKNVFKMFDNITQLEWIKEFGLTSAIMESLKLSADEMKKMGWKRKFVTK